MATTYTHAIEINSASDAVNLGSSASIDDLTGFTVGILTKFNGGTAGYGVSKHSASGASGWHAFVNTTGRVDCSWGRATTDTSATHSSGLPSVNDTTWCWVFVQFDSANGFASSSAFKVYSGSYGGALSNRAGANIVVGSGAYDSDAAQNLLFGSNSISSGFRTSKTAFIGIWNTLLSEATMDSYAADMDGNGGLAAAVDYIKWDATMGAAATSANAILTGTYVSTPVLVSGPDASTTRRRRQTVVQYQRKRIKLPPAFSVSQGPAQIVAAPPSTRAPHMLVQYMRKLIPTPTQRLKSQTQVFRRPRFMTGSTPPGGGVGGVPPVNRLWLFFRHRRWRR